MLSLTLLLSALLIATRISRWSMGILPLTYDSVSWLFSCLCIFSPSFLNCASISAYDSCDCDGCDGMCYFALNGYVWTPEMMIVVIYMLLLCARITACIVVVVCF